MLSFESTYIYLLPHRCLQNLLGTLIELAYYRHTTGGVQLQDQNSRLPEKKGILGDFNCLCITVYVSVACCMGPYVQFIHIYLNRLAAFKMENITDDLCVFLFDPL
jgi:hypothetical protein